MRAQEQHIEGRSHALILLWPWRQQGREIAAEPGAAAATGIGEEAEQLAQADDTRSMDDLPALAGGLRQPRPLQRCEVKRGRGGRQAEPARKLARRQAGRAFGDQQAQEVEARILRQGGEGPGGIR